MARKKRKPKQILNSPQWELEVQKEFATLGDSREGLDRRWKEFDCEGSALLRFHDFNNLAAVAVDFDRVFSTELEWFHDKLVGESETEVYWYCHLARENILRAILSPNLKEILLRDFRDARESLAKTATGTEEDRRLVFMLFMCTVALNSENTLFEHSSYFRDLLRHLRRHCCKADAWSVELNKSLSVMEAYEDLGDRSPYLAWVSSGYEGNPPDPHYREDEPHMRLVGLVAAIESQRLQVSLFREEELRGFLERMTEDGSNKVPSRIDELHHFKIKQWKQIREFLWSIRQTPRWEQIRTSIEIAAGKYRMSGRVEFRIWATHLKEWAQTLNDYHRGEHPVLKAALAQEMTTFSGRPE